MTRLRLARNLPFPLRRFARREDGNGTVELVILLPIIMFIFMMAFESSFYMSRRVMLERAVDMTTRSLRLGQFENPTPAMLKTDMCDRASILVDCDTSIRIELQAVSTTTWQLPDSQVSCVDRDEPIQPAVTFNPGAASELMLVRVCIIQDALFPGIGIGQQLAADSEGGYAITAVSSFVNEP